MPKKRQALVEYEDMNGSSTAVTYAADNPVYIAGHPAFINYSTSQKISRPGDSDESRSVNHVLLLTIMNPIYPITTVSARLTCWIGSGLKSHVCTDSSANKQSMLCSRRTFSTQFATTVGLSRESSSSGRTASRRWLNILLIRAGFGCLWSYCKCVFGTQVR